MPGGKAEEGDSGDVETATREAKEEIGLDPSLVNVVSVLEPFQTKVNLQFYLFLSFNAQKIEHSLRVPQFLPPCSPSIAQKFYLLDVLLCDCLFSYSFHCSKFCGC